MTSTRIPSATYRIQFSLNFRFSDARELIPYLHDLGISDLYASPRFKARKGSSHGYDVTDPQRINSELGTEQEFKELVKRLKDYGMGLLLDIVPNHMAASAENPWWMDVLENGPSSRYASFFDIDWHPPVLKARTLEDGKLLLPFLGDLYGRVLEKQEITLRIDESGFFFQYWDWKFPLNVRTYLPILERCCSKLRESSGSENPPAEELVDLMKSIRELPGYLELDPKQAEATNEARQQAKLRLWKLFREDTEFRKCLELTLHELNGTKSEPGNPVSLHPLLDSQPYRLAYWRLGTEEINYRRFFDINDLVGLRVELPEVFEARHVPILKLVESDGFTGLRVDHVDGLYDPKGYLERLANRCAGASGPDQPSRMYIIVEKILGANEPLPGEWPVNGTTGYDYLNALNGIYIDPQGLRILEEEYVKFTGEAIPFEEWSFRGNRQVMKQLFAADFRLLGHYLGELAAKDRFARDVPLSALFQVLVDVTACLPVYRTYTSGNAVSQRDRVYLKRAFDAAKKRAGSDPVLDSAFEFLEHVLTLNFPGAPDEYLQECLRFVMRWQQFSGPVMAKGLEDTAFYIHNALISLNEVGGDPIRTDPPNDLELFHKFQQERLAHCPGTLNATSTHDTKRSEDARARINVLSELAEEWGTRLRKWRRWNQAKKNDVDGAEVPAPLEEVFLYQTMLGAWPLDPAEFSDFANRLTATMIKAAREAKIYTSWLSPNQGHEDALAAFIERILVMPPKGHFLKDFLRFQKRVAFYGALNSLSQVLLKLVSPGVPDLYQGTDLWDFSMVDPDNRRQVDFQKRTRWLAEMGAMEHQNRRGLLADLMRNWQDGRIKLYMIKKSLEFRRNHQALFTSGDYIPLGSLRNQNVCAFARRQGKDWILAAAPVRVANIVEEGRMPLGRECWGAGTIQIPEDAPLEWRDLFTGETLRVSFKTEGRVLPLRTVFRSFPVALAEGRSD